MDANSLFRQLLYAIREALRNMMRSPFMSVIVVSTMMVALGVLGFLLLTISDLRYLSTEVSTQLKIVVFLKNEAVMDSVAEKIEQQIPGIKEVVKISRKQALDDMKEQVKELGEVLQDTNPFPDTLEIEVTELRQMRKISEQIKQQFAEVEDVKDNQDLALQLQQVESAVQLVGFGIASILFIATLAIVVNTIQLAVHHRHKEIEIMRLVGAPDWFIRLPFLIEGLVFGFSSALLAAALLIFWRAVPLMQLKSWFSFIPVQPGVGPLMGINGIVLVIGMTMGILGSLISVHRYLRFEKGTLVETAG